MCERAYRRGVTQYFSSTSRVVQRSASRARATGNPISTSATPRLQPADPPMPTVAVQRGQSTLEVNWTAGSQTSRTSFAAASARNQVMGLSDA